MSRVTTSARCSERMSRFAPLAHLRDVPVPVEPMLILSLCVSVSSRSCVYYVKHGGLVVQRTLRMLLFRVHSGKGGSICVEVCSSKCIQLSPD